MTNTFEAQVAADLVGKINRKEGLSWAEANEFKTRVTSNLVEIEKYLADQSAIVEARMKTSGADQGTNNFKASLAEIVKFKDAVTANANYLDQITAQHAHEKEAIVKIVKEKIGALKKEVVASAPSVTATPSASAPVVPTATVPETETVKSSVLDAGALLPFASALKDPKNSTSQVRKAADSIIALLTNKKVPAETLSLIQTGDIKKIQAHLNVIPQDGKL